VLADPKDLGRLLDSDKEAPSRHERFTEAAGALAGWFSEPSITNVSVIKIIY